MNKNIKAKG